MSAAFLLLGVACRAGASDAPQSGSRPVLFHASDGTRLEGRIFGSGDVGVVLLAHRGPDGVSPGYTVEITTLTGETVAVVDVPAEDVRLAAERDVRHARPLDRSA